MAEKTIAAIATPLGEGGIGVIRISGRDAISVADRVFSSVSGEKLSSLKGYRAAYGQVFDGDTVLDDAVALVFREPKSYTGEDVVELSVHGGRLMLQSVLRTVLSCGASLAEAGEFTKRAFLNGKLDLAKAESVMEMITAKNDTALRLSREAHEGRIGKEIQKIINLLLQTASSIAVYSDYPDEELPEASPERLDGLLSEAYNSIDRLISDYDTGRLIREGISCAIVGKPNVGKSTLMNLICGSERSIVTDIAGTTRDIIEDTVTVGGITLRLADTAGIHDTGDLVEKVGVDRALNRLSRADLILAVFDRSVPLDSNDIILLDKLDRQRTVVVFNKTDLPRLIDTSRFDDFLTTEISAANGDGLAVLAEKIAKITKTAQLDPDAAVLISERQRSCASRACEAVKTALDIMRDGETLDATGVCVDDALAALLELTGKRVTNEVADEVFRRFCVGK